MEQKPDKQELIEMTEMGICIYSDQLPKRCKTARAINDGGSWEEILEKARKEEHTDLVTHLERALKDWETFQPPPKAVR